MFDFFPPFIFLFLSGYILNQSHPNLRYKTKNLSGYNLFFVTLLSGLFLYTLTYIFIEFVYSFCTNNKFLICNLANYRIPLSKEIYSSFISLSVSNDSSLAKIVKTSSGAFIFSLFIYLIIALGRKILPENVRDKIRMKTVHKEFLNRAGAKGFLISTCMNSAVPILVSLKNRKSYVGYVVNMPYEPETENWNIKILPLRSGYRREDTLGLVLENDYSEVWSELERQASDPKENHKIENLRDFGITINWGDIETSSIWIPEIYEQFNKETL